MSNAIVPLVWLNETAMLDADTHDQLMTLVTAKRITRIVSSLFLGFGVLLLLVFSVGIVANKYKTRVCPFARCTKACKNCNLEKTRRNVLNKCQ